MPSKWRTNSDGLLEEYDDETGEVLSVEAKRKNQGRAAKTRIRRSVSRERIEESRETHHWIRTSDNRKVWAPKGTNPMDIPKTVWPYNQDTVEVVLAMVMEGKNITEICDQEGMPPRYIIYSWLRKHRDFKVQFRQAKEIRAEVFHDKAIMSAEEASNEKEVPAARLKFDAYKWAAGVNDPATFGQKMKISGDPEAPLGFIIQTGVPDPEEKAIEVKAEVEE